MLRAVDFGESDRIVHLLLPAGGRLTAIAKGARRSVRRFSGALDLFNHLKVQVERRRANAMARLDQATLIESFTPLRVEVPRFALGCYLLELLDRMAPEAATRGEARGLFAFSLAALRAVATRTPDARLRTWLELRLLDALGLRPELRCCVRCGALAGREGEVDFHVPEGGPLCATCALRAEGLLRVHVGTLRTLEHSLGLEVERLDRLVLGRATLAEARRLLGRFQHFHLGFAPRSEPFLEAVLQHS